MDTSDYISTVEQGRISKIALRTDGILHIDIKANELFQAGDFNEVMDAAFKIGKGKKFYNLITVGEYTIADHAARVLSTSKEGSYYKLADAFVINSLPQKLVANFYMNFHKPFVPTRFFNSKSEALAWLRNLELNKIEKSDSKRVL